MAFQNLSFETADMAGPGFADGWAFASLSRASAWAPFGALGAPWENFEREWTSNQNYLFDLGLLGSTRAQYQAALPPKTYENFEEFWNTNQAYVYGIAGALASYDSAPEDYEDFEEDWVSGYLYAFVGVGTDLTEASYAGDSFDGFESWVTYLYAFVGVGTDLTAGVYAGALDHEDFETAGWPVCNTV